MSQPQPIPADFLAKLEVEKNRFEKMASAMLALNESMTDLQERAKTDRTAKAQLDKVNSAVRELATQHIGEIVELTNEAQRRAASFCKALVECPSFVAATRAPDGPPASAAEPPDGGTRGGGRGAKKRKFA